MAMEEAWEIELVEDRGARGARQPGFVTGPRFLVRRAGATEASGVVELMLGTVYVRAIRDAVGAAAEGDVVLDLLDEVGEEIVRYDIGRLELNKPPVVTPLYVDGEGVDMLVERAARRG